jgi:hypothetical protein
MPEDQYFEQKEADFYDKKEREEGRTSEEDYYEETAAEVSPNVGVMGRDSLFSPENERITDEEKAEQLEDTKTGSQGRGMGGLALALSIISLFVLPVILGAAGIVIGFIARRRGARTLGAWAIGVGVASVVTALFIAPFF